MESTTTREERMQQRLRGAQRRQVKDVDFGLVFSAVSPPTPASAPAAARTTPQAEVPSSEPIRISPPHPTPTQPASSIAEATRRTIIQSVNDANTSAKRRKLDTDVVPPSTGRTRSSRALPRPDIYSLHEEEPSAVPAIERSDTTIDPVPESIISLEHDASPLLRVARSPSSTKQAHEEVLQSTGDLASTTKPGSKRSERLISREPVQEESDPPPEEEDAESISDQEAAKVLLKRRNGRTSPRSFAGPSVPAEKPQQPKSLKRRRGADVTPVQQRQPKKAKPTKKQKSQNQSSKGQLRSGSPIPVTVHRLGRAPVYDEDESDADILNLDIPRRKRGGVNSIDVLSQVCEEVVGTALEFLEEGGNNCDDPALRREYKTKWRAVTSFGNEVNTRLLEHTINLDNTYSLERRLRDEQKKKLGLRDEILRVRAEREKVALRMDEVRIQHENETAAAQDRNALNTSIHDIELAIDQGKATEPTSEANDQFHLPTIELMLKRIAGDVSSKESSGGILRQIKDFNAFLERAALSMETKQG